MHPETRDTISLEEAKVIDHQSFAGGQYLLRLLAPAIAAEARPGSFVHIRCDPTLPMRRPMSIMRADAKKGWIDILYKAHGYGTNLLARRQVNETLSLMGPVGVPFKLDNYRKKPLLIGGGVGIPPMVFLAEHIKNVNQDVLPLLIMGSEIPFPFPAKPSQIMIGGLPDGVIASMPLMEDWGIACRLTSLQGYPGCYDGYVTDLSRLWLNSFSVEQREQIEIFSCGPTPMLKEVAALAQEFALPCQLSLEEYMACAVGGCAGCAIRIETENGTAMKRVCVDGPVFEAAAVFPVN